MNLITTIKRRKPLLWIGSVIGVLLLLIATLAIYIGTRPDEWWRNILTATLSQTLGREVEIQGDFRLDLGRRITAEVASVRISNPDWTEPKDMLRLGSLLLEFDPLSALGDTLLIHRLVLADIELVLEKNEDGKKNWEFAAKTKPPPVRKPGERITLPVRIEQFSLQRAQLRLNQPRWVRPLVLKVGSITGGQSPNDEVVLDGSGRLGDLPFSFKGSLGKITSVLNDGPVSYQLSGKLGETRLRSEGSIDSLAAPLRPKLNLILSGPDIKQITQAMGAPTIAKGPFEVHVDITPGGRGVKSRIRGKFGTLQLHADISAEDLSSTENMDLTTRLSGENLAAFSDLLGLPPLPKGSFKIDAVLHSDNGFVRIEKMTASVAKHQISFGGILGAWPELKDTRLELQMKGPDLAAFTPTVALIGLGQLPPGAYSVNALIEASENGNGLYVRPIKVIAGAYEATAEGRIFTKDRFRAELNVMGSGPDLSMITRLVDTIQLPAWPFHATGRIDITGKDITLIGVSGTAGDHNVAVDGPIAFSSAGPLRLNVKGDGPSLRAVLKGIGYDILPSSAAYQLEGEVEITNNRLIVNVQHARFGPATSSATLSIPDLSTPTAIMVDVDDLKTSDISAALALMGVKLDLPQVMPANFSGQIKRTKEAIELSKVRGNIGTTTVKVDGTIGEPPRYAHTNVTLDINGPDLQHFLVHPVDQIIPFHIKGRFSRDEDATHFQNLQLTLGNIEAKVHGQLGSWEKLEGSEFTISAKAPNLDTIAAILNRPLPAGPVKLEGHVRGVNDAFHIDRLNAELGRSNLSGDLKLIRGETPRLKGQLSSSYLDFAFLHKEASEKTLNANGNDKPNTDVDNNVPQQQKQQLLFPHTSIELSAFDHLDLDLDIRIDEVTNLWQRGSLHNLSGKILLNGRDLSVSDFEVRGASGDKIHGDFSIGRDDDLTRIKIDIKGEQLRIGLAAAPGQSPETYPPTNIDAKLTGAGSTYRQLAASLKGRIKVVQGEGWVNNNSMLNLLSDTFFELFQAVNPFAKNETSTRMNCSVTIVNMADGTAEIQAVVIQTDKLTIVSAGTIDLNTERINLGFQTRPRRGVGISASTITNSYIKLGGRMAKPEIELDAERATIATGAAVATGGLSFLIKGVWDRYFSSRDPCGEALKKDAELQAKKTKQP